MATVEKVAGTMFALIFLYLALTNGDAFSSVINSLSQATNQQITALQGR